ncbi:MAG: hypothetical protein CYPHOPRED_002424 [Cyphobasidiales sp. Tagirdzhanova-0007]|nr:MAG: hypothetical protein CYPHOPRED_002424 [Cyphobasidiales sp. Tagirdzhanova-0007]
MSRKQGKGLGGLPVPDFKTAISEINGSVAQPFALPRKPKSDAEAQRLYFHVRTLCFWLDAASSIIQIPYLDRLPFSFGVEAIIGGLIPVVGDAIGFILGLYVVLLCMQFGLPAAELWKMFTNCVIDVLVGIVPIVGDLLDVVFKSNMRNLQILENHLLNNPPPKPQTTKGLTVPSAHFAVRIPPSGPFWPKNHAPETSSFYETAQESRNSTSFFANIFGNPDGVGSQSTKGWQLGGAKRVDIEEVGGWSGESAQMLWRWLLVIFAKVAGKTQQAASGSRKKAT